MTPACSFDSIDKRTLIGTISLLMIWNILLSWSYESHCYLIVNFISDLKLTICFLLSLLLSCNTVKLISQCKKGHQISDIDRKIKWCQMDLNGSLGNIHKGRPIFGMVGWSCKKGQNGTRRVGWLSKKGRPIFQSIIWETFPTFLPYDFTIEIFECDLY